MRATVLDLDGVDVVLRGVLDTLLLRRNVDVGVDLVLSSHDIDLVRCNFVTGPPAGLFEASDFFGLQPPMIGVPLSCRRCGNRDVLMKNMEKNQVVKKTSF